MQNPNLLSLVSTTIVPVTGEGGGGEPRLWGGLWFCVTWRSFLASHRSHHPLGLWGSPTGETEVQLPAAAIATPLLLPQYPGHPQPEHRLCELHFLFSPKSLPSLPSATSLTAQKPCQFPWRSDPQIPAPSPSMQCSSKGSLTDSWALGSPLPLLSTPCLSGKPGLCHHHTLVL